MPIDMFRLIARPPYRSVRARLLSDKILSQLRRLIYAFTHISVHQRGSENRAPSYIALVCDLVSSL